MVSQRRRGSVGPAAASSCPAVPGRAGPSVVVDRSVVGGLGVLVAVAASSVGVRSCSSCSASSSCSSTVATRPARRSSLRSTYGRSTTNEAPTLVSRVTRSPSMSMHVADDAAGGQHLVADVEGVRLLTDGLGLALLGPVDEEVEAGPDDEHDDRSNERAAATGLRRRGDRAPTAPGQHVIERSGEGGGGGHSAPTVAQGHPADDAGRPPCRPSAPRCGPAARRSVRTAMAARAWSMRPSTKARLWMLSRRQAVGSPTISRWRRYPRDQRAQVGHGHAGIERPVVAGVHRVAEVEPPDAGQHRPVAGRPGRGHAVELVDPEGDRLEHARPGPPPPSGTGDGRPAGGARWRPGPRASGRRGSPTDRPPIP